SLNESLQAHQREKESLGNQVQQQKEIIVNLDGGFKKTSAELNQATAEINSSRELTGRLTTELTTAKAWLDKETKEKTEMFDRLQGVTNELKTANWQLAEQKNKNGWLEKNAAELEQQVKKSDEEKLKYRDDLRKTVEQLSMVIQDNASFKGQLLQINDLLQQAQVDLAVSHEERNQTQSELKKTQAEATVMKQTISEKDEQLVSVQQKMVKLNEQVGLLQAENAQSRDELAGHQKNMTVLVQEKTNLGNQLKLQTDHLAKLQQDLESVRQANLTAQNAIDKHGDGIKILKTEIEKHLKTITGLNDSIRDKDLLIKDSRSKQQEREGKITALTEESARLSIAGEQGANDLKKSQDRVTLMGKEADDLKKQNNRQSEEITNLNATYRKDINKLNEQTRQANLSLDETTAKLKTSQDKAASLTKEISRVKDLNKTQEKNVALLQKDLRNATDLRDRYNEDLKEANNKLVQAIKDKSDRDETIKKEKAANENYVRQAGKKDEEISSLNKNLQAGDKERTQLQNQLAAELNAKRDLEVQLANSQKTSDQESKRFREQLEQVNDYVNSLSTDLAKVNERNSLLQKEMDGLTTKLKESEYQWQNEVRQVRAEKMDYTNKFTAAQEKIKTLEWSNTELSTKETQLRKDLEITQRSNKNLVEEMTDSLEKVRVQKSEFQNKLANAENEIVVLQKKDTAAGDRIIELEKKVLTLEAMMEEMVAKRIQAKETELLGKLQEANETIKRREKDLTETRADTHYNAARFLTDLRRYPEAVDEYDKSLALRPNDKNIYYNMGLLYDDKMDNPSRAVFCYEKYLGLTTADDPERPKVEIWRGNAQKRLKGGGPKGLEQ
ncbi:MAG: tetratricopeptide repeat protein, partial [Planctomycetota bacterium]